ncbi:hypothetical protein [Corynebacterium sp. A21]|uniref:hypothetical protein n=1 Tax=Corynebacterium sp. A21 TaxID=3457318 RepID=UPI003FD65C6C
MNWIDTNGAPYVVEGAGMTVGTILLSLLAHVFAFLLSAGIGSLVGVIRINGGMIRALLTSAVMAAGITAFGIWLVNHHFAAEILWAGIPATIIAFGLTWWVGRRLEV